MTERVLFCGSLGSSQAKSFQRFSTLQSSGVNVRGFNLDAYFPTDLKTRIGMRLAGGRFPQRLIQRLEGALLQASSDFKPDILWMEKSWLVTPSLLNAVRERHPSLRILNYQVDNPFGTRRRDWPYWKDFLKCLPVYDVVFEIRPDNVRAYYNVGAKRVVLTRHGFHESFRPRPESQIAQDCRHDVVFVGTALDRRPATIRRLLLKHQLPVEVYGSRWDRTLAYHLKRRRFHGETGDRYPEIVSGSKISLGFVSLSHRDEYTERSIDIPACGGFLLAERTPKHQELYAEHSEAEFFDDDSECADKVRYYLRHEVLRAKIAAAGCRRCRESDYRMTSVVRDVLDAIKQH